MLPRVATLILTPISMSESKRWENLYILFLITHPSTIRLIMFILPIFGIFSFILNLSNQSQCNLLENNPIQLYPIKCNPPPIQSITRSPSLSNQTQSSPPQSSLTHRSLYTCMCVCLCICVCMYPCLPVYIFAWHHDDYLIIGSGDHQPKPRGHWWYWAG